MIENMYNAFVCEYNEPRESFERLLEFMAADFYFPLSLQFEYGIEQILKRARLVEKLKKHYDPGLLSKDVCDPLGDLYCELFAPMRTQTLSGSDCTAIDNAHTSEFKRALVDSRVGTGSSLIQYSKKHPNTLLYGVDRDLTCIRIALINSAIYKVPMLLLHANPDVHEIDPSTENGRFNWQYSNCWDSHMDRLKEKQH